jgi:hypothetical protein
MTSEWTICATAMPTEEALDIAARIADAEEPDCEDLLLTEGARVCDVLRCEVLHQAEVIERLTADLSTAAGECERLRAALAVAGRALEAASTGERLTTCDELARLSREVATLRAIRMEPMTPAALDAACAAEDRACVDDPLLDATDGAHPAWWRGHDRAAEMLTAQRDAALADAARARAAYATDLAGLRAEVRRADDERAAWRGLRDAALEMLTALEAPAPVWDADESEHDAHAARLTVALDAVRTLLAGGVDVADDATMRRDLPAEAVVPCPACGYGITADLDDDGVYVTRRHSRRKPARVGLGEIVWCDGGLVVP